MQNIENYLSGDALYGDNFGPAEIAEWHADEKEGYANLGAKDSESYNYGYHAWNNFHAYRYLDGHKFQHVLGFGSAYGDELLPIVSRIERITIVDPSEKFSRPTVHGVPSSYVQPTPQGALPLPDDCFDLITCLGVLHHIPNVTFVFGELARVLRPSGCMVLREPIVSMGDWRKPRAGLTKRERGIPLAILRRSVRGCGLEIARESVCAFPLTQRLFRGLRPDVYNSGLITRIDALLCQMFSWNINYHPRNALERLRPTSAFLVIRKNR